MQDKELMQAASCLPPQLRTMIQTWAAGHAGECEEIRLRAGCPLTVASARGEIPVGHRPMSPQLIQDTVDRACEYSVHTFSAQMSQGFLTIPGGHRIGLCGDAVWENGRITSFRSISSMNIRVARQITGAATPELLAGIGAGKSIKSSLFFSPPQYGKTTLLRDVAKSLSEQGYRVGIADERGELAALHRGQPQFSVGRCTDVITGCPKAEAALMLVKTMSPAVVVLDEITTEADIRAALSCSHCGAAVLASAHADSAEDFLRRPLYRKLLESRVFSQYFSIRRDRSVKQVEMEAGRC